MGRARTGDQVHDLPLIELLRARLRAYEGRGKVPPCVDTQRYTSTGTGTTVFYRLDGLVDRASDQGVFPPTAHTAALTQREAHSSSRPGVDVVFEDGNKNKADVIGLYGGAIRRRRSEDFCI